MMRTFVDEKIAPHAAEYDRTQEFPWKSFEACRDPELPALGIPEEYGGAGADMVQPRRSWPKKWRAGAPRRR
jgi:alkylation response protein AidB-like acyl-CoA dehydrogenase